MGARPEKCDACGESGTAYADMPELILCDQHAVHLNRERRIASNGWRGPMPRLTPFRLGVLSHSFATYPRLVAKLERLAAAA